MNDLSMENIKYYTGNRLEKLAAACANLMQKNPLPPLSQETILIQTQGMERWLSLELARINGIFSSYRFISYDNLVDIAETLSDSPTQTKSPYDRDIFPWSIMAILEEDFLSVKNMKPVAGYIAQNELKRFQIASRVADIFDQYALYRPDMLERWESGRTAFGENAHENWQFAIWRKLNERYGEKTNRHRRLRKASKQTDGKLPFIPEGFPKRIICFGISIMPHYYLELLAKISAFIPVYLFHMNPSQEYWGDTISSKRRAIIENRLNKEIAYAEHGNQLLASFGNSGREFLTMLYTNDYVSSQTELFEEMPGVSLLQNIQNDITFLKDRSLEKGLAYAGDESVKFVSCHSPMRELEILHDYLLGLFNANETLKPHDILVLSADINKYAPYINAIFGTTEKKYHIPYSIADQSMAETDSVRLFLDMLALISGRLEANAVISVIDTEIIRNKFGLTTSDIEIIRSWASEANIRWGLDADFKEELGLPKAPENTWLYTLDRMLLGYALKEDGIFFNGIYPFDRAEGDSAKILGNFASFILALAETVKNAKLKKTLHEWEIFFSGILSDFFDENGDETSIKYIRNQIKIFKEAQELCGFANKIGFDVMRAYLKARFNNKPAGRGFITGGLTFCSMVPLRSIPFKIICILGMNDGVFPRKQPRDAFDLIAIEPKPGDRDTRKNDQYLFLETILSAREKLYISYIGRNIKNNSRIPPSPAVIELQDYIRDSYDFPEEYPFKSLITEHPLQGFSPSYFLGKGLSSFREDNFEAAVSAALNLPVKKNARLSSAAVIKEKITSADLTVFLRNTSKYFLYNCLNVDVSRDSGILEDFEPFELSGLGKYNIKERLLKEKDAQSLFSIYKSSGFLPGGTKGKYEFDSLDIRSKKLLKYAALYTEGREKEIREFNAQISGFTITARCPIYGNNLILFRPAEIKAADRINLWIQHLIVNFNGFNINSIYIGEKKDGYNVLELDGADTGKYDPQECLGKIISLFTEGHSVPVPFFPETSWAYIDALYSEKEPESQKSEEKALRKANEKWFNYIKRGDKNDPYVSRCFTTNNVTHIGGFQEAADDVLKEFKLNVTIKKEPPA
ncbi:MAG: exodeoxyribonuclease V subunit gamma [Leptospirales bacterium]|nr:exodeoxyribonuclease V subunit gamma [Leptospirales bacterium]